MARVLLGSAVVSALLSFAFPAFSQAEPPPTAAYPESAPATAAPAAPAAQGPVAPAPPPPAAAPPPATAPPPAAAPTASQSAASRDSDDGYNVGHSGIVEPVAPPPKEEEKEGFKIPDFSVRVDPLNWIINGRLGLELEVAVWKIISVELVPVFVTSEQPPFMNLDSFQDTLHQKSNGLGAMSGTSIGAGFWLSGKPFVGTVLRFYFTDYGYRYLSKNGSGAVWDEVTHTERQLVGFLGSHQKWGPFTIASGIGLGVEMNRHRRCPDLASGGFTTNCTKEGLYIGIPDGTVHNLNGWLHPAYLSFRLSLGFVF